MRVIVFVCDRCDARDERVIIGNETGAPEGWKKYTLAEVLKEHPYQRVVGKIHYCRGCAERHAKLVEDPELPVSGLRVVQPVARQLGSKPRA